MRRQITEKLRAWKDHHSKKPLMMIGARQTGKTYVLNEFCKEAFSSSIYINLEYEEDIRQVFESTLKPEEIIDTIQLLMDVEINPEETVIFFDEIQVSERAVTSLKYFNEAKEAYKIVCAGSLLGVALNRFESSFPVGKVYRCHLYPFSFREFLWGIGEEKMDLAIAKAFNDMKALMEPLHKKCLDLYKDYLYVGGMPASILAYLDSGKRISRFDPDVKRDIIDDYLADMSKYTTAAEQHKIGKVYHSMPKQLGNEGRFNYRSVDENGSKRKYESSIDWLLNSHIAVRSTLVETPRIPLKAYHKESIFKLYMNDIGLLMTLAGMEPVDLLKDEANLYKGMLTESYIAQTFISNELPLYFWKSKNNAEMDFLVKLEGHIIPVEVKASTNSKSKSLKVYRDLYEPAYCIKISANNFNESKGIKSIPLYAAYLIGNRAERDELEERQ